ATPSAYLASAAPFSAVDLQPGDSGVVSVLDNTDDGTAALDLGASSFTFYGTTYAGATAVYVGANGLITFGAPNESADNGNFATSPSTPAIAPFWDDLRTDLGVDDQVLARFEDLNNDGQADRLIIEWNQVEHFLSPAGNVTFQAVLQLNTGSVDGTIQFNYLDADFGDPLYNNGRSATIGVTQGAAYAADHLLVSRNNGVNPLVSSSSSVLIDRIRPTATFTPISPNPISTAVDAVTVTFSEAIDATTFNWKDLVLKQDGVVVPLTNAVSIISLGGNAYSIQGLSLLTNSSATFELSLDQSGVRDLQGHPGLGTTSVTWTATPPVTNIVFRSATANGLTQLTYTYDIENSTAPAFGIGVLLSMDGDANYLNDTRLTTLSITALADRTVGQHVKTLTIGTAVGNIALPGAGLTDSDVDYRLMFVADPDNLVVEQEPVAGSDNAVAFTGVYHAAKSAVMIQGTTGNDVVTVNATPVVSFNGVNYSYALADVTAIRARLQGGNDSIDTTLQASKPLLAHGGAGNDTLRSGATADLLFGGDGNDILDAGAGVNSLTGGAGDNTLTAGSGADTYRFNADGPLGTDTLNDAGGIDSLDFSSTLTTGVQVDLSLATAQLVNGNLTLVLGSATAFENLTGGGGSDTLIGNTLSNTLTGNGGDDDLRGGTGSDTYRYLLNSPAFRSLTRS
ncbi:MAG: hypothetical protein NT069_35330, partial [Planctomycetota bacterium]|nr:hypothetical protein [Planctomycetota bacterium]